jgi:hypothetical protein
LPEFDTLRIIDVKNDYGRAAILRAADENGPEPFEVSFPQLPSRIEKPRHLVRQRISAAQIRTLVEVTSMTTPRAIARIIGAAMLAREHVLDVKSGCGGSEIGQVAVLAPVVGPFADKFAKGLRHQSSVARLRTARALA